MSRASGTARPRSNSHLLKPLAALYGAIAAQRLQRRGLNAGIPVLCVGNYHVGGAGKTPTVLALAKLLRELGETPVVLSRGYGGKLRGPVRVDPVRHAASDVGDEPLMLAGTLPVVVSRKRARRRAAGARARRDRDPDGRRLPEPGGRQGRVPDRDRQRARARQRAGVSRRSPARAAAAATGAHRRADHCRRRQCRRGGGGRDRGARQAGAAAHLKPDEAQVAQLRGKRVLAFAGIGDPARFFNTLRASGIDVAEQRAFADHHPYSQAEIESLIAEAKRDALTLVTTEKDLARLRDWAQQIVPFPVTLEFDDRGAVAEVRRRSAVQGAREEDA